MKPPRFEIEPLLSSAWFKWLLIAVGLLYVLSMLVVPWISSHGNWDYVQRVWDRWQSLNVGVLAFAASYMALQISRFNTNERNRREFVAARAFFPQALSDLSSYCSELVDVLLQAHARAHSDDANAIELQLDMPRVPDNVYPVLDRCIRTAPPQTAEFIAQFLGSLQVALARSASVVAPNERQRRVIHTSRSLTDYIADVVVIRIQIDLMFPFARNETSALPTQVEVRAIRTAFAMLGIRGLDIPLLEESSLRSLRNFARSRGMDVVGE